jgi:hypothetical protein
MVEQIGSVEQGQAPLVNRRNGAHKNVLNSGETAFLNRGGADTPDSLIQSALTIRQLPAKPVRGNLRSRSRQGLNGVYGQLRNQEFQALKPLLPWNDC